ncbi:hypothetical protein [Saccharopolyspora taberi]|uniref:Uncharacterized protein n=1 Tax=Saccharopolyspora taberi TaxID=60895 RepID=A0ABN3V108_9PSEU
MNPESSQREELTTSDLTADQVSKLDAWLDQQLAELDITGEE